MNKEQQAKEFFEQGYNCCQAVFAPFAMQNGMDKEISLKVSSGFAAGLCYQGETCGAVIGAQMALGLHNGYVMPDDDENRANTKNSIAEFRKSFEQKHSTTICKELLGNSPATVDGMKYLRENGIFKEKCPHFVKDAVKMVQDLVG